MNRSRYSPRNPAETRSEDFGLVGWLEQTRVHLPLHSVECRFTAEGNVLAVEMDQLYHQNARAAVNLTYLFPLPAGAAVYLCEIRIGDRVIVARIEEQKEARRLFKEKQAEGRRVAMVESERENLFTLSLGNIQPGDDVRVRIAYFQVLEHDGDRLSLRIPVCPGIRYIPGKTLLRSPSGAGTASDTDQVPDASRITPSRIKDGHPDAAVFVLHGTLDASIAVEATVSSPSHPVIVRPSDARIEVTLADKGDVPDRDFVLRWNEPRVKEFAPRAWSATHADQSFAIAQIRAPVLPAAVRGLAQDFYVLLDRSGSMQGAKWTKACEALVAFAHVLGADDRLWLTLFENNHVDFAEKPLPPGELLDDPAFRDIKKVGTEGGTKLLPALEHLLEALDQHSHGRHACLFVITDGEVGNEERILTLLTKRPELRVHVFGVDTTVNDAFLKAMAHQHRGQCFLLTPDDDIPAAVTRLAEKVRRPVLTDLHIEGGWETPEPGILDLHSGEVLNLPLRRTGGENPIVIIGTLPDGSPHRVEFVPHPTANAAIPLLWMRARIAHLLEANRDKEAIKLARAANLLCKGAAFIAWDETERVPIASQEMLQPSLEPGGWIQPSAPLRPAAAPRATLHHQMPSFAQYKVSFDGVAEEAAPYGRKTRKPKALVSPPIPPPPPTEEQLRAREIAGFARKLRASLDLSGPTPLTLRERYAFGSLKKAFSRIAPLDGTLGKLLADVLIGWVVEPSPDRARRRAAISGLAEAIENPRQRFAALDLCRAFVAERLRDAHEFAAAAEKILNRLAAEPTPP